MQRLATGQFNNHVRYLKEWRRTIYGTLSTSDLTPAIRRQLELEVQRINKEYMEALGEALAGTATQTGRYSAGFTQRQLEKIGGIEAVIPADDIIDTKVLTATMEMEPGVKSLKIQEAINQYGVNKGLEVNRALSEGLIAGNNTDDIIKSIGSVIDIAETQLKTLTRTIVNTTANTGRMATFQENKDKLQGYEWVAKLDDRTTEICTRRDGTLYEFKAGNPMPPAHWNCRSQITPVFIDEKHKVPKRERDLRKKMIKEFESGERK